MDDTTPTYVPRGGYPTLRMTRAHNIVATEHHITVVLFDLLLLALLSLHPRFARSSLSHSSRWSCWGSAWAGQRIPGPDVAPGTSDHRKGADTTTLFPALCRGDSA